MKKEIFEKELNKARTMMTADPDNRNYWQGYQSGLRKQVHGEEFGNPDEHESRLNAIESPDKSRADYGRGYQDGLNFKG